MAKTNTSSLPVARYQLRRAILESVLEDTFGKDDHNDARKFFGGCAFCGSRDASRDDHLIPVNDLGDRVRENVAPACQRCDDSKGDQDYRDWMRHSRSKCSLRSRGKNDREIEQRIKKIGKWQRGYKPRSLEELLAEDLSRYEAVLEKMDRLVAEAQQLVVKVRARQGRSV